MDKIAGFNGNLRFFCVSMRNVRDSFGIAPGKELVDYVSITCRLRLVYVSFTCFLREILLKDS